LVNGEGKGKNGKNEKSLLTLIPKKQRRSSNGGKRGGNERSFRKMGIPRGTRAGKKGPGLNCEQKHRETSLWTERMEYLGNCLVAATCQKEGHQNVNKKDTASTFPRLIASRGRANVKSPWGGGSGSRTSGGKKATAQKNQARMGKGCDEAEPRRRKETVNIRSKPKKMTRGTRPDPAHELLVKKKAERDWCTDRRTMSFPAPRGMSTHKGASPNRGCYEEKNVREKKDRQKTLIRQRRGHGGEGIPYLCQMRKF